MHISSTWNDNPKCVKCKIVQWLPLKFEKHGGKRTKLLSPSGKILMVILVLRTYASLTFKTCSRDANEKAARNTNGYRWIGQPTPFWGGWVRVIKIDQISFIIVAKFCCRTPLLFSIDFFEGVEEIHLRKKRTPKRCYANDLPLSTKYLNGCFSPTTIHKRLWYVMMRFVAFLQIVANATCYSFINLTNMRMQMFRCSYVWCISTCVTHPNLLPEIVWNHCCWIL